MAKFSHRGTHRNVVKFRWETRNFRRMLARRIAEAPIVARELIVAKIAMDMLRIVLTRSPVDTGRYRAAWIAAAEQAGLDVPFRSAATGSVEGVKSGAADGKGRWGWDGPDRPYIELINGVHYGIYLEFGRPAIHAKPGKFLSWIDRATGERIFAKKVKAMRGQLILTKAMARARQALAKSSFKRFLGARGK